MSVLEAVGSPKRSRARNFLRLSSSRTGDALILAVPYVMLAVLVFWYGSLVPESLTGTELTASLNQALVLMFAAVGQTLVLLSGGIDLSVGGMIAVSNAICAAYMSTGGRSAWIAVALILLGWIPGALNGLLIVGLDLQPFIVTLGTWFIWDGIAFYILPTAGGSVAPGFASVTSGSTFGIDNTLIIVAALALFGMWFLRTRIGVETRAVGADPGAALLAGVRRGRAIVVVYSISSLCAVISGIMLSSQNLSGDPTVGDKYLLSTVAAAVIGGTSLFGGSATVVGTLAGALVLGYVGKVIFAVGLQSEWGLIFSGVLLAFAVAVQGLVRAVIGRNRRT